MNIKLFRYFIFFTFLIGIVSEMTHPSMGTWKNLSIATYTICICVSILGIAFRKEECKCIKLIAIVICVWLIYIIITAIAYLRVIDAIVERGLLVPVIVIIIVYIIYKYQ